MNISRPARLGLYAILFLFFFQLFADFIEAIYAFGLLGTGIPPELAAVVLLLSPFLLLLRRQGLPVVVILALARMMFFARLAEPLVDTRWRMMISGVGVAAFLLLLPALLWSWGRMKSRVAESELAGGLLLAVAASVTLRTLGSGSDLSTTGIFQITAWAMAVFALWAFPRVWLEPIVEHGESAPASRSRVLILSLGIMAVFVLLYFAFTAPHVLARWSGVDYRLILPLFMAALLASAWLLRRPVFLQPRPLLVLTLLLILALSLAARLYQVDFPAEPAAYPLSAPAPGWPAAIPLFIALLAAPVLWLDFAALAQAMITARPSNRDLGFGFGLAALALVILIFAHVFTTVYDYVPLVGPLFRDEFWTVHLAAGVLLFLALAATRPRLATVAGMPSLLPAAAFFAGAAVVGSLVVFARPPATPIDSGQLRVLTYNVQQGYSATGSKNFEGQLALITELAPDVIGLQESDDARVANGNVDIVRYFADHLDLYSYYGPKTVTGTFGVALLSRYPIEQARTHFLYSRGEQVAVIEAQIQAGGRRFNVFVTHLGNGGPSIQQQQFLTLVEGRENVIAMGDWNFRPAEAQYANMTAVLDDSWTRQWPDWRDDRGQNPRQRKIDHIFISPNLQVLDARFIDSPASDHPAVSATLGW